MAAKVYSLKAYKKRKKLDGLTFLEYWGIIINVILVMMIATFASSLFFYRALNHSDADKSIRYFTIIIGMIIVIFSLKHLKKVIDIFKKRQIQQNLQYLLVYVMAIALWSGMFSLFSFGIVGSVFAKIKWFLICQIFCAPNVFLLIRLWKKKL